MRRWFTFGWGLLSCALAATPAGAQALPPGHPPLPQAAPSALPSGHPPLGGSNGTGPSAATNDENAHGTPAPTDEDKAHGTPAPTDEPVRNPSTASPHGADDPHAARADAIPRDENAPAADLPRGSIEAFVLDQNRLPQPLVEVRLGIMFQRISEGESRSERFAKTDAAGRVRFDGLTQASEYSYRVTVARGPAEYATSPFSLHEQVGQRLRIHVFPVTRDVASAMLGMRGFVYIEPRDDVFHFQVLYRAFNVGAVTWVPENTVVRLPSGFKAFSAPKGMTDVGFDVVEGQGARLKGTISPGQHDLSFTFQVPKSADSTAVFGMTTLPRVAELRVIAEASSQMRLTVDGFEEPQVASNQQGKRVLVTRRVLSAGDELSGGFTISLAGLPVPSMGRWFAVFIALGLGCLGLATSRGLLRLDDVDDRRGDQDLMNAREILLDELVDVERSRRRGALGPRAYAEARRTLLDALTRLGKDVLEPPATKRVKRRPAAA